MCVKRETARPPQCVAKDDILPMIILVNAMEWGNLNLTWVALVRV